MIRFLFLCVLILCATTALAGAPPFCSFGPTPQPSAFSIRFAGSVSGCTEQVTSVPCRAGELITFTAQTIVDEGTCPLGYLWDLGDGTTTGGKVVAHQYGAGGNYNVRLTAVSPINQVVTNRSVAVTAAVPALNLSTIAAMVASLLTIALLRLR